MANVEKQTIFKLDMEKPKYITILLYDDFWYTKIYRIIGRKKVERHMFKIKKEYEYKWFECDNDKAQQILKLIKEYGKDYSHIDIFLNPIRIKNEEPKKEFISKWKRFKNFIWRKK